MSIPAGEELTLMYKDDEYLTSRFRGKLIEIAKYFAKTSGQADLANFKGPAGNSNVKWNQLQAIMKENNARREQEKKQGKVPERRQAINIIVPQSSPEQTKDTTPKTPPPPIFLEATKKKRIHDILLESKDIADRRLPVV